MKRAVVLVAIWLTVAQSADAAPPPRATRIEMSVRPWSSYVIEWKSGRYEVDGRPVDPKAVDALLDSLSDLQPSDGAHACVSSTTFIPSLDIVITGTRSLELRSSSRCHDYVPWYVIEHDRLYVQYSGAIQRALHVLLVAIDPDEWTIDPELRDPPTTTSDQWIDFGTYTRGIPAEVDPALVGVALGSSLLAACVHSIETSPRIRRVFGHPVRPTEVKLTCDLYTSPDCQRLSANASFPWGPVDLAIDVPCVNGTADRDPTLDADLRELRSLLASKPMRAFLRIASQRPRIWRSDEVWDVFGGERDARLAWWPQKRVIYASTYDSEAKLWPALGVDPARLPFVDDGIGHRLDAIFDTDAKLVADPWQ